MKKAENEENNTTNQGNFPPSSAHYNRVVYIGYTIVILVNISSGLGFKKNSFIFNYYKKDHFFFFNNLEAFNVREGIISQTNLLRDLRHFWVEKKSENSVY